MAISKKEMNIEALKGNISLFSCPICRHGMEIVDQNRFVCQENHSFDISKQGYIHLAPQARATKYDAALFEARNRMMNNHFFRPLLEKVIAHITPLNNQDERLKIGDAGSGEGSHLAYILKQLARRNVDGIGIDLAKEGVLRAARDYPGHSWVVADLANSPFQKEAFHVILNILSPANYGEFVRILKENGVFIKVLPGKNYLKQLREVFGKEEVRSNRDVTAQVAEYFEYVSTERVTYDFPLDENLLASLIRMTPLTWHASEKQIEEVRLLDIPFVTVDLIVIVAANSVGKKGAR